MPERVLITGATGFVGSHLAEAFVGAGYEVRCGVRACSDTRWISHLPVERVPLYLDRQESLTRALEDVEVIVHAAGITRARRPDDYHSVNAVGTARLARAAIEAGGRRFVLIGSLAARGPDANSRDGQDHPTSDYGRSKLEAEAYLRALDEGQMETVVLRPAAVYGPRDTDMLPLFKMARGGWLILPPGPGLLQPVYAADLAQATLAAADDGHPGFGPFPVAEAGCYAWREIIGGLERALGRPIRTIRAPATLFRLAGRTAEVTARGLGSVPVFDERRALDLAVHTWTCDPSHTEKALKWRAEVPLYEGLERTARWYREAKWL